ncbi:hypothetical protein [Streptomyces sp. GSL17-111]|uniref:hypothetical protein n=1 Tax=Streptomyces sp. GSL17-111 TaxID=3121596 RepID=UPI0030F43463
MSTGIRLLRAATALVLLAQSTVVAVFAFVLNSIAAFAPLDEPPESVAYRVRISMVVGGVVVAVGLWACGTLLRSCVRGTSARTAIAVAAVLELALVASALVRTSGESVVLRGAALVLLVLCFLADPAAPCPRPRRRRRDGDHGELSRGVA